MAEIDEQDQSEVFDETHLDDEGDTDKTLDELDPVYDVTQAEGDADLDDEIDDEDAQEAEDRLKTRESLEHEADTLLGGAESEGDDDGEPHGGPDEVELVYDGLMRDRRGAQASAAHWEARRLADDDIASLGYAPDEASQTQEIPR
jgi:hypothetical protein